MKIIVGLFINKRIATKEDIDKYTRDMMTYVNSADKVLIFNISGTTQDSFYSVLTRFKNVEYTTCPDYGEVGNYKLFMHQAVKEGFDYAIPMELDYYYHEDTFLNLKRMLLEWKNELPCILSPQPLFTCEEEKPSSIQYKGIMGCHLVGAFVNVADYKESDGFDEIYYQTTFDYDYCLTQRSKGKHIYVSPCNILRNRNFRILERKILLLTITSYEVGAYHLYYETRNRMYLWNKFKDIDPKYIKRDKKYQRAELKEMRICDRDYKEKRKIMILAKYDYSVGQMGKKFETVSFHQKSKVLQDGTEKNEISD